VFLPWLRRFLIGFIWGISSSSVVGQLVASLVVEAAYIAVIFIFNPYTDYLQHIADVMINILTLLSFVPLFTFTIPLSELSASAILAGTVRPLSS